jgi:hypothetical protein
MNKLKRKEKIILTLVLLLPILLYFSSEISMIWHKKTCATVLYLDKIKGSTYVYFKYQVDSKTEISSRSIGEFKYRKLKDLKQKSCFWIEYSTIFPKNTRIIDKDLKAD